MSRQVSRRRKRQVDIQAGGNVRKPEAKLGIVLGIFLAAGLIAVFHSAVVMGLVAVVLVIAWILAPKKK